MRELLTYPEIAERLGISVNLLRQWVNRGKFPKPDAFSAKNAAAWYEETVDKWERTWIQ